MHRLRVILILGLMSLWSLGAFALELTEGLVGYWPLDGNGRDLSGNGHDAVLREGAKWVDHGWVNGAVEFDGVSGYVVVDDSFVLSTDTITVIARIKGWKTDDWSGIVAGRSETPFWMGFSLTNTLTYVWNDNSADTWGWSGAPGLPKDKWALVAIVIEPNKVTSYVYHRAANRLDFAVHNMPHINQTVTNLKFGWDECCGVRYFKGLIDEVMIYDRALNAEDITRLATLGITGSTASPVQVSFVVPTKVGAGEEFTASLNITDTVDLAGAQFDLHFNPTVLEATDIHAGDFLSGDGVFFQVTHFNGVPGEISGVRIARANGVDGSGTLLKVDFKAKAVGISELALRNLKLGTSAGAAIPANVVSGKVEVASRPDVTGDGKVNILDLVLVSRHFGPAGAAPPDVDINGDGQVDILDIIVLAQYLSTSNTSAAPARLVERTGLDAVKVQGWLSTAYVENDGSLAFAHGIANLEALLAQILPTETAIYANYPNPFNPETWLPYQLADAANVTFRIYSASGHLVRTLVLGHQAAGLYQSRSRAVYWDGRDALGEPVASGVYFYTLRAGDFTATRKMLVRK